MFAVDGASEGSELITNELRSRARWIRDDLHPRICRGGPESLDLDTLHELHEFLGRLPKKLPRETIRQSRIHRALVLVTDKSTQWPDELAVVCEPILLRWAQLYGNLQEMHTELYGPGGRLYGIAEPQEISRRELVRRWADDPNDIASPLRACEHGHLGYKPGHWWIHPVFAYHDGIISSADPKGGITADGEGAYAVTLTDLDHVDDKKSPENFKYSIRTDDSDRFRLINSMLPVKTPIRVLRSHTLHSVHAPVAGLRYDGLYKIMEWSVRTVNGEMVFEVTLLREFEQLSWSRVAHHPTAEEIDDYMEYRRLRELNERALIAQHMLTPVKRTRQSPTKERTSRSPTTSPKGASKQTSRPVSPLVSSPEPEDFTPRGRRTNFQDVHLNEAEREELNEMRSFEFPPKKTDRLTKPRRMPSLFSAERL